MEDVVGGMPDQAPTIQKFSLSGTMESQLICESFKKNYRNPVGRERVATATELQTRWPTILPVGSI